MVNNDDGQCGITTKELKIKIIKILNIKNTIIIDIKVGAFINIM